MPTFRLVVVDGRRRCWGVSWTVGRSSSSIVYPSRIIWMLARTWSWRLVLGQRKRAWTWTITLALGIHLHTATGTHHTGAKTYPHSAMEPCHAALDVCLHTTIGAYGADLGLAFTPPLMRLITHHHAEAYCEGQTLSSAHPPPLRCRSMRRVSIKVYHVTLLTRSTWPVDSCGSWTSSAARRLRSWGFTERLLNPFGQPASNLHNLFDNTPVS